MNQRIATCGCGQVRIECRGEPVRLSICHCLDCQRRTGAPFGTQSWFPQEHLTITGTTNEYVRAVEGGNRISFHFCPTCASTVYWLLSDRPGIVAIAVGMFGDPAFPQPRVSVWERRRHPWTVRIAECEMEHIA
jgi:hypothetical protein